MVLIKNSFSNVNISNKLVQVLWETGWDCLLILWVLKSRVNSAAGSAAQLAELLTPQGTTSGRVNQLPDLLPSFWGTSVVQ